MLPSPFGFLAHTIRSDSLSNVFGGAWETIPAHFCPVFALGTRCESEHVVYAHPHVFVWPVRLSETTGRMTSRSSSCSRSCLSRGRLRGGCYSINSSVKGCNQCSKESPFGLIYGLPRAGGQINPRRAESQSLVESFCEKAPTLNRKVAVLSENFKLLLQSCDFLFGGKLNWREVTEYRVVED